MAKSSVKEKVKPTTPKESPVTPLIALIPEEHAKKAFWGLAILLLVLMGAVSHEYGISGDENFHRVYGYHIVDFYSSFGKDQTCIQDAPGPDSLMRYYGGFYDGTATLMSKALPSVNEWNVRHFWNSMFGCFAMICAGLVAVEMAGWQAGLFTLLLMAFSPRFFGESMNNPKDITMAAGYMFSYIFILKFLKQLPKPSLKVAIGLGLSIGMAMGIRIGGLLLIPYTFLFYGLAMLQRHGFGGLFDFSKFSENIWPSFKYLLLASVLGYCASLIFWPYGLVNPISHPLEALGVAEKFPVQISILFEGKSIRSTEVPWYYIPKWLMITTPLVGLLGLIASFALWPEMKKQKKVLFYGFLYFTIVFPIAYVIYKKSVLYDTMRHFFFVYPSIVILAGITFSYFASQANQALKYGAVAVMVLLMLLPGRFMFANHPNEYVYFNELVGGIKGAFGNYETDYYMNSVKQSADWLRENENLKRSDGRKNLLLSNAVAPCNFYFEPDSANVAVGYTSYRTRNEKNDDYEILYCRFVDRDLLINGCYPPEQVIHTVYADGVPLSCVVKKEDKGAYNGMELMNQGNFAGAINVLEPYAQKYPKNEVVLSNLGLCYLNLQRYDDAVNVLTRSIALNSLNPNGGYWLGLAYLYKQDFAQAATVLDGVVKQNPYYPPPYRALAECMMRLGQQDAAQQYLNIYQQLGGAR